MNYNKLRKIISSTYLLTIINLNTLIYETWNKQIKLTDYSNGKYLNNKGRQLGIMNFASCFE